MTIAFFRTIILYLITIIVLRIMGKRQVGELSPSELVVTILISELAAIPMQDNGTPLLAGIIPIFTLLALEIITSTLALKSEKFKKILVGKSSILISDGIINQNEMKRIRLTLDELLEELRLKGYTDLSTVQYAILETGGKLTVIPYSKFDKVSREDLNIEVSENSLCYALISDGNISWNNLYKLQKDKKWLERTLAKNGYKKASEIFLMQLDKNDHMIIIPKE